MVIALSVLSGRAGAQIGTGSDVGVVHLSDGSTVSDPNNYLSGSFAVGPDHTYGVFRRTVGDGRDYNDGYTSFQFFTPIYVFDDHHLLFSDTRFNFTDDGQLAASVGGGFRKFFAGQNRILSGSFWFDTDESDQRNRYNQFGFSLEWLGDKWNLRGNFYNPTSHGPHKVGTRLGMVPFFRGNHILFSDIRFDEVALTGADLELGVPLPGHPDIKGYAGLYYYDSKIRTDKLGIRGRLEAYLSDALTVELSISQDPLFGTNLAMATAYTIGANWQLLRPYRERTVEQRMHQQVARTDRMALRTFVGSRFDSLAINP